MTSKLSTELSTYLFPSDPLKFIQEQAQKAPRPIPNLPNELILKIFQNLSLNDLCKCCIVCKDWSILGSDKSLWTIDLKNLFSEVIFIDEETWTTCLNINELNLDFKVDSENNLKKTYVLLTKLIHLFNQEQKNIQDSLLNQIILLTIPENLTSKMIGYSIEKFTISKAYTAILLYINNSSLTERQKDALLKIKCGTDGNQENLIFNLFIPTNPFFNLGEATLSTSDNIISQFVYKI